MKLLRNLLIAPIAWFIQACSPLGKPVDIKLSDNFYYNKSKTDIIYSSMGNWFELGKTPLSADAETFQVLNHQLGKDKNHAYYRWHAIPEAAIDLESFTASVADWMWHIGMDKDRVFEFDQDIIDGQYVLVVHPIDQADPDTYERISFDWAKDQYHVFYNSNVYNADVSSFALVNELFAKDAHHVFLFHRDLVETIKADPTAFQRINRFYAKDGAYLYSFLDYEGGKEVQTLIKIPYTNIQEVEIFENGYVKVSASIYYNGKLVGGLNGDQASMPHAAGRFIKDNENVYYEGKLIRGADAPSFKFDDEQFVYRDRHRSYNENELSVRTKDQQLDTLQPFEVSIALKSEKIQLGEDVTVEFFVKNVSKEEARFCQYHTPFEGIKNEIFTVWYAEKEIAYQGILKKRIPPTEEDYLSVPSGEKVSCQVKMDGYSFKRKGSYVIQFSGNLISGLPASNTVALEVL